MTTPQSQKSENPEQIPSVSPTETAAAVATRERIRKIYRVELHTVSIRARGDWSNYGADVYAEKDEADEAVRDFARSSCHEDCEVDIDTADVDDLEGHLIEMHDHEITRGTTTALIPAEYLTEVNAEGQPVVSVVNDTWDEELAKATVETCPSCGVTAPAHLPCPSGCGAEGGVQ